MKDWYSKCPKISEKKIHNIIMPRQARIDALANRLEELFGMEKGDIYSSGKYRKLIKPRSVYCYWAVRELGETATSLAKRLSLTQPGVSKSVLRGEKIVKDMNLKIL